MRKKITLLVVVALLLVLVLVGVSLYNQHSQASKLRETSDRFVTDIMADNPKASYALFTKNTQQNETLTTWTGIVDKISAFFKGAKPGYSSTSASGTLSTVKYTIKGSDGNYNFDVVLQSAGSGWQIESFTSKLQP